MSIVAMVPIKMNNERLKNKNTKILGNQPLIEYILSTLVNIDKIDEIYVFCSNEEICQYLPEKVKFLKRDKSLDLPTANFTQFFQAFTEIIDADTYVFTHATAPFLTTGTIEECIDAVEEKGHDSAFTAIAIQDFLWEDGKPMNFDATNLPRSQDLKKIYRETSGVYVFKKEVFSKTKRRIGENPYIKEVSWIEAVDINTKDDFALAEMIVSSKLV